MAKKSSRPRRTPKKSAKKKESGQAPEKLIIEVDVKSFNDSPVYYFGSWQVKKVIRKRRK